jgi:hypothetical protein
MEAKTPKGVGSLSPGTPAADASRQRDAGRRRALLFSGTTTQRSITRHGDIDYSSRLLDHHVSLIPGLKLFFALTGVR